MFRIPRGLAAKFDPAPESYCGPWRGYLRSGPPAQPTPTARNLFATAKAISLDAQNVVDRRFKPLLKHTGHPIYAGTASGASLTVLLCGGVHPKYVQHLAGHSSIQLTLDRLLFKMPSVGRNTAVSTHSDHA
jgi:hypothetical protein